MDLISKSFSVFWYDYYNTDDSYLPLLLPLTLWINCWLICTVQKINYGKFTFIHLLHHIIAMIVGSISLYYFDDDVLKERVGIMFSISYFVVDLFDCIIRYDVNYAIHATLCLCLGYYNFTHPVLFQVRSNSCASFIELSTPIFQLVKYKRTPVLFVLFAISFTLCRIIWVPCIGYYVYSNGVTITELPMLLLFGFYCLNWYWYSKILKILWTGGGGEKKE